MTLEHNPIARILRAGLAAALAVGMAATFAPALRAQAVVSYPGCTTQIFQGTEVCSLSQLQAGASVQVTNNAQGYVAIFDGFSLHILTEGAPPDPLLIGVAGHDLGVQIFDLGTEWELTSFREDQIDYTLTLTPMAGAPDFAIVGASLAADANFDSAQGRPIIQITKEPSDSRDWFLTTARIPSPLPDPGTSIDLSVFYIPRTSVVFAPPRQRIPVRDTIFFAIAPEAVGAELESVENSFEVAAPDDPTLCELADIVRNGIDVASGFSCPLESGEVPTSEPIAAATANGSKYVLNSCVDLEIARVLSTTLSAFATPAIGEIQRNYYYESLAPGLNPPFCDTNTLEFDALPATCAFNESGTGNCTWDVLDRSTGDTAHHWSAIDGNNGNLFEVCRIDEDPAGATSNTCGLPFGSNRFDAPHISSDSKGYVHVVLDSSPAPTIVGVADADLDGVFDGETPVVEAHAPGDLITVDGVDQALPESTRVADVDGNTVYFHLIDVSGGSVHQIVRCPDGDTTQCENVVQSLDPVDASGFVVGEIRDFTARNGREFFAANVLTFPPVPPFQSRDAILEVGAGFAGEPLEFATRDRDVIVPGIPNLVTLFAIDPIDAGDSEIALDTAVIDGVNFVPGVVTYSLPDPSEPPPGFAITFFKGDEICTELTCKGVETIDANPDGFGGGSLAVLATFTDGTQAVVFIPSAGAAAAVGVPNVGGLLQADAEAAIVAAGLAVGAVSTANSDTVPAGDVISQNPTAGTQVPLGSAVDLVVSSGPAPVQGDIDGDSDVDRNDIITVLIARNQPASGPDDPRDLDGDGIITVLDARIAATMCTRPRCATE